MATLDKTGSPFAIIDSGRPSDTSKYVTLVMLHGFAWHSGIFSRWLPLAKAKNVRIVLVNRRDYPGTVPYTADELALLNSSDGTDTLQRLEGFMTARALELYRFLVRFVKEEKITSEGGVILAGWSFGSNWMLSFLANAAEYSAGEVDLSTIIRKVVLYDPPYHALGYLTPPNSFNPLTDPSIPPAEGVKQFPMWVSGYWKHGDSADQLERNHRLQEPPPTILTMKPEEIGACLSVAPADPGGSDHTLLIMGIQFGLFGSQREKALYKLEADRQDWNKIPLELIWCDHSIWETPYGAWELKAEIEGANRTGKQIRDVKITRMEGANHFAHWDRPEDALDMFLAGTANKVGL